MKAQKTRSILIAALALALLAPGAASADDGDKQRAQALLVEGNDLLAKRDYAAALDKFQAAYDAYPSPSLLLNIGTTLRALGRNAEAANAYARWVRARRNPQRLAEVEEVLRELDRVVARLEVEASEEGARVSIDGNPIDPAALPIVRLEPGGHIVRAEKPGFEAAEVELEIAAGEKKTARLELEPLPPAEPAPVPDQATEAPELSVSEERSAASPGRGLRIAGLSAAGLGLAGLAVGVKFGLDARSLNDELDEEGQRLAAADEPWTAELLAKQDEGERAETRFIAFTAIGAGALVAGGVLYYLGYSQQSAGERSLVLTPSFGPASAGWAISGAF